MTVNFILKDADHGLELTAQGGTTSHNDGDNAIFGVNFGLPTPFIDGGFINTTLEYSSQGNTVRGLFEQCGFVDISTSRDGEGRERVTSGAARV